MIFKYFAFANLFPNLRKAKKVPGSHCLRELFVNTIAYASAFHPSFIVPLKFIRRVAGKISNHTVGILQVKNNKNGIVGCIILAFHNRISHAGFLYLHIIFKNRPAVETKPRISGIRNRYFHLRISLS